MEPATPYVRGKYYFYRNRLDEATQVFAAIPQANPYFFQARYFIATIQVKRADLAGATQSYDALLKLQAPDQAAKDVQDLARLAIARILYERSQFDKAIETYLAIPRQSKYWSEALREQTWTYIKAKDWQRAYRSVNLLLLADPDVPDGPDLRILEGNLQLRMSNFYLASDTFSKVRDEFDPIHRQLQQVIVRSQTEPAYFDQLIGKSLDKFDIAAFVPPAAAKWVKSEPEVARMMVLATDMGDMQRDLADSQKLLDRIQSVMDGRGRVGIFPDLSAARTKSVEMMNQLVGTRQTFAGKIRTILDPVLSADERKQLDRLAIERDGSGAAAKQHADNRRRHRAARARDEATLRRDRSPGVRAERRDPGARGPAGRDRELLPGVARRAEDPARRHPRPGARHARDDRRAARRAREAARSDRRRAARRDHRGRHRRVRAADDQEAVGGAAAGAGDIQARDAAAAGRRPRPGRAHERLLSRCDAIEKQLQGYDQKIDGQATTRLVAVNRYLAAGKEELSRVAEKLGAIMEESKTMGGGLAQAMFTKVADKFYDLVVRSDVGIIDVSWGLKDQKTQAVTRLTNQKSMEIKALDEDFRKVLEEDK